MPYVLSQLKRFKDIRNIFVNRILILVTAPCVTLMSCIHIGTFSGSAQQDWFPNLVMKLHLEVKRVYTYCLNSIVKLFVTLII